MWRCSWAADISRRRHATTNDSNEAWKPELIFLPSVFSHSLLQRCVVRQQTVKVLASEIDNTAISAPK